MTDTQIDPAVSGLLGKYEERLARKKQVIEKIAALQLEAREIDTELHEFAQALRTVAKALEIPPPELPTIDGDSQAGGDQGQSAQSIKALVESIMKAAYPGYLKSKDVREKIGGGIGDKTVGMALYRLGNEGVLRHVGWKWFYIPKEQREEPVKKVLPEKGTLRA